MGEGEQRSKTGIMAALNDLKGDFVVLIPLNTACGVTIHEGCVGIFDFLH